jgi:hypothetical protein
MNERIRQLALDAGIGFTLWDDSGREMIDNYTPEEDLAKFAELIVRECAEWIKNTESNLIFGEEDAKALLEHFGVET